MTKQEFLERATTTIGTAEDKLQATLELVATVEKGYQRGLYDSQYMSDLQEDVFRVYLKKVIA